MVRKILIIAHFFIASSFFSQSNQKCLDEILTLEKLNDSAKDSVQENNSVYVHYMVKTTNWEDETTVSNVKMYKNKDKMHFFSEQVNIYTDGKEAVIEMPYQKILMVNAMSKQKKESWDNFLEMKKVFLENCDVSRCENKGENTKVIVLKTNTEKNDNPLIKISEMVYEISTVSQKITSLKINYTNDYKVKEIVTIYKDYDETSSYTFAPLKSYLVDKRGVLLSRYKGYELIDNRDDVPRIKTSKGKS